MQTLPPQQQQILKLLQKAGEAIDRNKAEAAARDAAERTAVKREEAAVEAASQRAWADHTQRAAAFQPPDVFPGRILFHRQLLLEGNNLTPDLVLTSASRWGIQELDRREGLLFHATPAGELELIDLRRGTTVRPPFRRIDVEQELVFRSWSDGHRLVLQINRGWRHAYALEFVVFTRTGELISRCDYAPPKNSSYVADVRLAAGGAVEFLVRDDQSKDFLFYRGGKLVSRFHDSRARSKEVSFGFAFGEVSPPVAVTYRDPDYAAQESLMEEWFWNLETGERLRVQQCSREMRTRLGSEFSFRTRLPQSAWGQRASWYGSRELKLLRADTKEVWKTIRPYPDSTSGYVQALTALFLGPDLPLLATSPVENTWLKFWALGTAIVDVESGQVVQRLPGYLPFSVETDIMPAAWTSLTLRQSDATTQQTLVWYIDSADDLKHAAALGTDNYESANVYRDRVSRLDLAQRLWVQPRGYDPEKEELEATWRGTRLTLAMAASAARKLHGLQRVALQGKLSALGKQFLELVDATVVLPDGSTIPLRAPQVREAEAPPAPAPAASAPPPVPANGVEQVQSVEALYQGLRKLDELRKAGLLLEEEFQQQRKALVDRME